MGPEDVLELARNVPARWSSLELVHRSGGLEIGIVVSSRDLGGRLAGWFTNEIVAAT